MSRQPLSTTTNFNDIKQQHHHYAPIATNMAYPLYTHYQQQNPEFSNSLSFVPSMPITHHQVPSKYKENIHRNSTLKLRRCVALFLHLIGINFYTKYKFTKKKFLFYFHR